MPIVKIEMVKGKSHQYKKDLLEEVHQALVDNIKIPDHDRNQRIHEYDKDNFEVHRDMTMDAVYIEITLFEGRSLEAKKALYRSLVNKLSEKLKIKPDDIMIVLREEPMQNWGIRGGQAASEINLGFTVKV